MNVIQTSELCKSYRRQRVLHNVDLVVGSGRLVGFLGPNGAGKTTTIRILMGLLSADSGEALVLGKPCRRFGKAIRCEVGYLPGDVHPYPDRTGANLLKFAARVRGRNCADEFERLAQAFVLDLSRTTRKYSTGMRQKLGLILAMMHKPELLILDEPTSGLDPLVRNTVFGELKNAVAENRSVLFSSHSLDEVEELCDEVIILRAGRIVEQQSIDVLQQRALRHVEIEFAQEVPVELPLELHVSRLIDQHLYGTWSGPIAKLVQWLAKFQIRDVIIERPNLGDLFMAYYSPAETHSDDSGRSHV